MTARPSFAPLCSMLVLSFCLQGGIVVAVAAEGDTPTDQTSLPFEQKPEAAAAAASIEAVEILPVKIRVGRHASFERLVFDLPRSTAYSLTRQQAKIILHLEGLFDVDVSPLKRMGLTKIRYMDSQTNEGTTLTFLISPTARLKDFKNDGSIVLDVRGEDLSLSPTQPALAAAPAPVTPPEPEPEKTTPPEETPPPQPDQQETPPVAAADAPTPLPSPLKEVVSAAIIEAPQPVVEEDLKTPPKEASSQEAFSSDALLSFLTNVSIPEKNTKLISNKLDEEAAADVPKPVLIAYFDPGVKTGAVIYERSGYGFLFFDRKITVPLNMLVRQDPPPLMEIEPISLPKVTGFIFPLPNNVTLRASSKGTAWEIYASKNNHSVPVSAALIAQPTFALGSRMLLPSIEPPDPINFLDPIEGDALILVPLRETSSFGVGYSMADFSILPSAQGLVLKPLHNRVFVQPVPDGIEISAKNGGLKLSPNEDTGLDSRNKKSADLVKAGKTLFDLTGWQGRPGETFQATRQRLSQTIVDVSDFERNRARLELARFFFSHGLGEETRALLQYLEDALPDIALHEEFKALKGAASILAGHPEKGLQDLNALTVGFQPEITLWQAIGSAIIRDWAVAEEKFSLSEDVLFSYPDPFFSRFMILAIESATAMNNDRQAMTWLDRLEERPHSLKIAPAIAYLRGVLYSKSGRADVAEKLWRKTASGADRLYKIRAELALIDLSVATQSITPLQAAERLEGLRFAWRGDDLEIDILDRLGSFYIESGEAKLGLNILNQAVKLYPNSTLTPFIQKKMGETFRSIFLSEDRMDISALEAFTLYEDFSNLIPEGAEGIIVARKLAEQLVMVDLLDQATSLLTDVLKKSAKDTEYLKTAARLTGIYLLDKKPDSALAVLESTALSPFNEAALPLSLQNERLILHARALTDKGDFDKALSLIKDKKTQNAQMLRADINMRAKRWNDAAKALRDLIGAPPKPGTQISSQKAAWLVNEAVALALGGNTAGLDALAIEFSAAMSSMPQKDTFNMLTRSDGFSPSEDLDAAQSKISEVDMFKGFLDSYRKPMDEKQ